MEDSLCHKIAAKFFNIHYFGRCRRLDIYRIDANPDFDVNFVSFARDYFQAASFYFTLFCGWMLLVRGAISIGKFLGISTVFNLYQ